MSQGTSNINGTAGTTAIAIIACSAIAIACGGRSKAPTTPTAGATPSPQPAAPPTATPDAAPTTPTPDPEPQQPPNVAGDGLKIVVPADGGTDVQYIDPRDLLDAGNAALAAADIPTALRRYDQLVAEFPESSLVGAAMFNAGIAYERAGDLDSALVRYRKLGAAFRGRDSIDGQLRATALAAELGQWKTARDLATAALALDGVTDSDRVESYARLGYANLESSLTAEAKVALDKAIAVADAATAPLSSDDFVAMARFYLAEIPRRRFAAMPLRLPSSQMVKDVEAKSDLLLAAENAYAETIKLRNVYWATAAGYRLASAYQEFWEQLVTAPIPAELAPKERTIYIKEVHGQVAGFLRKAAQIHQTNLRVAKVSKFETEWSRASKKDLAWLLSAAARAGAGEIVAPSGRGPSLSPKPASPLDRYRRYAPARFEL